MTLGNNLTGNRSSQFSLSFTSPAACLTQGQVQPFQQFRNLQNLWIWDVYNALPGTRRPLVAKQIRSKRERLKRTSPWGTDHKEPPHLIHKQEGLRRFPHRVVDKLCHPLTDFVHILSPKFLRMTKKIRNHQKEPYQAMQVPRLADPRRSCTLWAPLHPLHGVIIPLHRVPVRMQTIK